MISFTVAQSDIVHGERGDCAWCPVALAMRRVLNKTVEVGRDYIQIERGKLIDLPKEVKTFVRDLDRNMPVRPFTFELEIDAD